MFPTLLNSQLICIVDDSLNWMHHQSIENPNRHFYLSTIWFDSRYALCAVGCAYAIEMISLQNKKINTNTISIEHVFISLFCEPNNIALFLFGRLCARIQNSKKNSKQSKMIKTLFSRGPNDVWCLNFNVNQHRHLWVNMIHI